MQRTAVLLSAALDSVMARGWFCCGCCVSRKLRCALCCSLRGARLHTAHTGCWSKSRRASERCGGGSGSGRSVQASTVNQCGSAGELLADLQVMSELESMFPNDKDASYASPRLARGRQWARSRPFCAGVYSQLHAIENAQTRLESGLVCLFAGLLLPGVSPLAISCACVTPCGRSFRPPSAAQ